MVNNVEDVFQMNQEGEVAFFGKNLLFSYIGGSHLYNLNTPDSDLDVRGVFFMEKDDFLKGRTMETLQDSTADVSFFELGKFCKLLHTSTPNALECLYGDSKALFLDDWFRDNILSNRDRFLSKKALKTLCGYAYTQIKKATGYNKKCSQEKRLAEEGREYVKPNVLDFCFVATDSNEAGTGSMGIREYLEKYHEGISTYRCGLAKINNSRDGYHLFIPKGVAPSGVLFFNIDAYSSYCREYKEHEEWVKKRNPVRYEHNLKFNYDVKNMSHTFRLIYLGLDLLEKGTLDFRCEGERRDFLMEIRNGKYEYDYLLSESEKLYKKVLEKMESSSLPDEPDHEMIDKCLIEARKHYYNI